MSDNLTGLIASADRRRRAAILLFGGAIGLAALFPHNDRAMWVPESETPFVFTAVPEKLPVTYLTIPGADALLRTLGGFPGDNTGRRLRSRFLPSDPTSVAPPSGAGNTVNNIPNAAVPEFADLPTQLADAQTAPGGLLNSGPGGGGASPGGPTGNPGGPTGNPGGVPGGIGGGGPGTLNDPDPVVDPPVDEPPVDEPPVMSPVPEPVTWAMFIFGFGMIGAALRRRRQSVFVAKNLVIR